MGIEFTIGEQDFLALSPLSGRYAKACDPGYPVQELHRFRIPGTTGQLVIQGGTGSRALRFVAEYRAADVAALSAMILADRAAWSDTEIECVTDEGETVARCLVLEMKRGPIVASGRGVVKCEVEITVESNAGV